MMKPIPIIRRLATVVAPGWDSCYLCSLDEEVDHTTGYTVHLAERPLEAHDADCPWRAAKEWVAAHPPPPPLD